MILLALRYGSSTVAVHFITDYVFPIAYRSGIFLGPIVKYSIKVCGALKQLLNEPTTVRASAASTEPENAADIGEAVIGR